MEEEVEGEGTLGSLPAEVQTLEEAVGGLRTHVVGQIHGRGLPELEGRRRREVAGVWCGGPAVCGLAPGVHPPGELAGGMDGERRPRCRI